MDLVRPLGMAGIDVAAVARPGARTRYSRFTRDVVEWADPWRDPELLLERLMRFAQAQPSPPVLFYEGDWDLLLVSRHRRRLAQAFRFVVADADLIDALVDKSRFRLLAARVGLPTPPSVVLGADDPGADVPLELPLVVKPLTRQAATWEGVGADAKAVEVRTSDELRAVRERLAAGGVDALAQELVPGPESRIESYHVYVDDRGDVVAEFTGRKIRTYPAHHGHSTALELTDAADVAEMGRACVDRLGLRGVAKLDFKRAPEGDLRLLEINPRFNLWHHLGAVAGVNLPALVYADLVGLPRPAVRARPGARWCQPRGDRRAAREAGLSTPAWLGFVAGCDARSALAWDDPLPIVRGGFARLRRGSTPQPRVNAPATRA